MTGDDKPPLARKYPPPGDTEAWTELAVSLRASPGDLMRCLAHDMPAGVRLAAALNPAHPVVAAYAAAGDPDPVIRASAVTSPWLDSGTRNRLAADLEVLAAAERMTGEEDAPWQDGLNEMAAASRDSSSSARLAGASEPAVSLLAQEACRRLGRPDLEETATRNASLAVREELSKDTGRDFFRTRLRAVIAGSVYLTVSVNAGAGRTDAERRRASLGRAAGMFIADHGRPPSESELADAQHALARSGDDHLATAWTGYPAPDDTRSWTDVAADPHSTPEDLARCLAPRMPEPVRIAATLNPSHDATVASMASADVSPVVRGASMLSPWLDEDTRTALMNDPAAMDSAADLSGDEDELRLRLLTAALA